MLDREGGEVRGRVLGTAVVRAHEAFSTPASLVWTLDFLFESICHKFSAEAVSFTSGTKCTTRYTGMVRLRLYGHFSSSGRGAGQTVLF